MGFNHYFAGHVTPKMHKIFLKYDAKRLFNFYDEQKAIRDWINMGGHMMVDSGAFPAYKRHVEIDIDEYIEFVNSLGDFDGYFVELDKIPGEYGKPKTFEELEEATKTSWENYLYMLERVDYSEKLLPVFHKGEEWDYLHEMIEKASEINNYICLAPIVGTPQNEKKTWLFECYNQIEKSKNPDIKTHLLGMTSLSLLTKVPAYSADSTTWVYGSKSGDIVTPFGNIGISEWQKGNKEYIENQSKEIQEELTSYINENGFDIEELKKDYIKRWEWNIYYIKKWADSYKYIPNKAKQKKLF